MKDYYVVYYEEVKTVYKVSAENEDEARRKGDDLYSSCDMPDDQTFYNCTVEIEEC